MDFESKLPQKRVSSHYQPALCDMYVLQAYSASVVGYIELLGIHCARHLKVCSVCMYVPVSVCIMCIVCRVYSMSVVWLVCVCVCISACVCLYICMCCMYCFLLVCMYVCVCVCSVCVHVVKCICIMSN